MRRASPHHRGVRPVGLGVGPGPGPGGLALGIGPGVVGAGVSDRLVGGRAVGPAAPMPGRGAGGVGRTLGSVQDRLVHTNNSQPRGGGDIVDDGLRGGKDGAGGNGRELMGGRGIAHLQQQQQQQQQQQHVVMRSSPPAPFPPQISAPLVPPHPLPAATASLPSVEAADVSAGPPAVNSTTATTPPTSAPQTSTITSASTPAIPIRNPRRNNRPLRPRGGHGDGRHYHRDLGPRRMPRDEPLILKRFPFAASSSDNDAVVIDHDYNENASTTQQENNQLEIMNNNTTGERTEREQKVSTTGGSDNNETNYSDAPPLPTQAQLSGEEQQFLHEAQGRRSRQNSDAAALLTLASGSPGTSYNFAPITTPTSATNDLLSSISQHAAIVTDDTTKKRIQDVDGGEQQQKQQQQHIRHQSWLLQQQLQAQQGNRNLSIPPSSLSSLSISSIPLLGPSFTTSLTSSFTFPPSNQALMTSDDDDGGDAGGIKRGNEISGSSSNGSSANISAGLIAALRGGAAGVGGKGIGDFLAFGMSGPRSSETGGGGELALARAVDYAVGLTLRQNVLLPYFHNTRQQQQEEENDDEKEGKSRGKRLYSLSVADEEKHEKQEKKKDEEAVEGKDELKLPRPGDVAQILGLHSRGELILISFTGGGPSSHASRRVSSTSSSKSSSSPPSLFLQSDHHHEKEGGSISSNSASSGHNHHDLTSNGIDNVRGDNNKKKDKADNDDKCDGTMEEKERKEEKGTGKIQEQQDEDGNDHHDGGSGGGDSVRRKIRIRIRLPHHEEDKDEEKEAIERKTIKESTEKNRKTDASTMVDSQDRTETEEVGKKKKKEKKEDGRKTKQKEGKKKATADDGWEQETKDGNKIAPGTTTTITSHVQLIKVKREENIENKEESTTDAANEEIEQDTNQEKKTHEAHMSVDVQRDDTVTADDDDDNKISKTTGVSPATKPMSTDTGQEKEGRSSAQRDMGDHADDNQMSSQGPATPVVVPVSAPDGLSTIVPTRIERVSYMDGPTLASWYDDNEFGGDKVLPYSSREWSEWWVCRCRLLDPGCEMVKLVVVNDADAEKRENNKPHWHRKRQLPGKYHQSKNNGDEKKKGVEKDSEDGSNFHDGEILAVAYYERNIRDYIPVELDEEGEDGDEGEQEEEGAMDRMDEGGRVSARETGSRSSSKSSEGEELRKADDPDAGGVGCMRQLQKKRCMVRTTLVRGIRLSPRINPEVIRRLSLSKSGSVSREDGGKRRHGVASVMLTHIVFQSLLFGTSCVGVNCPKSDIAEDFHASLMGSPICISEEDGRRYYRVEGDKRWDVLQDAFCRQLRFWRVWGYDRLSSVLSQGIGTPPVHRNESMYGGVLSTENANTVNADNSETLEGKKKANVKRKSPETDPVDDREGSIGGDMCSVTKRPRFDHSASPTSQRQGTSLQDINALSSSDEEMSKVRTDERSNCKEERDAPSSTSDASQSAALSVR